MPDLSRFSVLDDLAKWRDPIHSFDLLFAGSGYLYERLGMLSGREAPLRSRLLALSEFAGKKAALQASGQPVPDLDVEGRRVVTDLEELGTIGYGLWHLRSYEDSVGFRKRLRELATFDLAAGNRDRNPQLRGCGMEFVCAGVLAREGFGIQFIADGTKDADPRPDFLATRDGLEFPCEITSRYPEVLATRTPADFWERIIGVAEAKKRQLKADGYSDGVLHVDCTPFFGAMCLDGIAAGELHYMPADGVGPSGSVPLIRYDDTEFSKGLREFEGTIADSAIRTLMLWNREVTVTESEFGRRLQYRVLGTMAGSRFWRYFPKAVVFPGPGIHVDWGNGSGGRASSTTALLSG